MTSFSNTDSFFLSTSFITNSVFFTIPFLLFLLQILFKLPVIMEKMNPHSPFLFTGPHLLLLLLPNWSSFFLSIFWSWFTSSLGIILIFFLLFPFPILSFDWSSFVTHLILLLILSWFFLLHWSPFWWYILSFDWSSFVTHLFGLWCSCVKSPSSSVSSLSSLPDPLVQPVFTSPIRLSHFACLVSHPSLSLKPDSSFFPADPLQPFIIFLQIFFSYQSSEKEFSDLMIFCSLCPLLL